MLFPSARVPIRAKTFIGKMRFPLLQVHFYANRTNLHEERVKVSKETVVLRRWG